MTRVRPRQERIQMSGGEVAGGRTDGFNARYSLMLRKRDCNNNKKKIYRLFPRIVSTSCTQMRVKIPQECGGCHFSVLSLQIIKKSSEEFQVKTAAKTVNLDLIVCPPLYSLTALETNK